MGGLPGCVLEPRGCARVARLVSVPWPLGSPPDPRVAAWMLRSPLSMCCQWSGATAAQQPPAAAPATRDAGAGCRAREDGASRGGGERNRVWPWLGGPAEGRGHGAKLRVSACSRALLNVVAPRRGSVPAPPDIPCAAGARDRRAQHRAVWCRQSRVLPPGWCVAARVVWSLQVRVVLPGPCGVSRSVWRRQGRECPPVSWRFSRLMR